MEMSRPFPTVRPKVEPTATPIWPGVTGGNPVPPASSVAKDIATSAEYLQREGFCRQARTVRDVIAAAALPAMEHAGTANTAVAHAAPALHTPAPASLSELAHKIFLGTQQPVMVQKKKGEGSTKSQNQPFKMEKLYLAVTTNKNRK